MAKRLMIGLLAAVLVVTVLPGVTMAKDDGRSDDNDGRWTDSVRQDDSAFASPAANGARFDKALVGNLRKRGFQVSRGYPMLYPIDACAEYTYPAFKTCNGNNPAAPYVQPVVKSWPNEYVDPAMVNAFGRTRRGYSAIYRLDPREAIVIYGQMPPPGRYMGLQTMVWSQQGRWEAKDYEEWARRPDNPFPMRYLFQAVPPDDPGSERVISFSALGDIVNNVVMERQSGYAFGEDRYFIITPSATTDRAVRRALQEQGVPDSHIFTEQVPSRDDLGPIGPLGMGKDAIDFTTFFRYAIPDHGYEDAAEAWRSQLPLTVLRVRAPSALGPVRRYGSLTFEPRTGNSEAYLAGDLQNLVGAVCDRASSSLGLQSGDCKQPPPASSVMPSFDGLEWFGPYCRSISKNCMGDQQDAAFSFSNPLPLDSGQAYAMVGTLATQTGNATYVGLGVNDVSTWTGVANVLDATLQGSADGYAATVDNTGMFYVHYFARDCAALGDLPGGAQHCTEITPEIVPLEGDTTAQGDPSLKGLFMVSVRDYIAPGTQRAPDSSKLLPPRILTFTKP